MLLCIYYMAGKDEWSFVQISLLTYYALMCKTLGTIAVPISSYLQHAYA